jgi:DNA polymerase-3 subunit alpha
MILRIYLPGLEETVIEELKAILERNLGECPVFFELETPLAYRLVAQSIDIRGISPSEELAKSLESLLGENSVIIEY